MLLLCLQGVVIAAGRDFVPRDDPYCHCSDCRRWTSAPVAAFAAFDEGEVVFTPNEGSQVSVNPGVTRTFCGSCGSPLTLRLSPRSSLYRCIHFRSGERACA